ncbi:MAG: S-adenosylmethionine:tRNA ribosyltransferase-isomerase [Cytophagales bacterium]
MLSPKQINIKDFSYKLPDDKIAKHPLADRDQSKLLFYKNGKIIDAVFEEISNLLPQDSHLVVNNTKVIQARILIEQDENKAIEIFLLEPAEGIETSLAMNQKFSTKWHCMVGNLKKFKAEFLVLETQIGFVKIYKPEKFDDTFNVQLEWEMDLSFSELLEHIGLMPLPPYLNRSAEEEDKIKYQTVYAEHLGSVAAPTAGLHFTNRVFEALKTKSINAVQVSLHVGAGTFRPVKASSLEDHNMHEEEIVVSIEALEELKKSSFITAVGTTSLRTLETIYWVGVKIELGIENFSSLLVSQWEPYELVLKSNISFQKSVENVLTWLKMNVISSLRGKTQLLIAPGYQIKSAHALITNFHQPDSTLLLLVAAFVGEDWQKIYQHALKNNYRFLSFGDSSLLMR